MVERIFTYDQAEIDYLKSRDPKLGEIMDRMGSVERRVNPDLFSSLLHSIISQQISTKAAETVYRRFVDMATNVRPDTVAGIPIEDLQKCGMTMKKAGYIKGIAQAVVDGTLDLQALGALHGHETLTKAQFAIYKERYAPYGSVASLYLWEFSHEITKG